MTQKGSISGLPNLVTLKVRLPNWVSPLTMYVHMHKPLHTALVFYYLRMLCIWVICVVWNWADGFCTERDVHP